MRARHTPHSLPTFPVYASAFLSPDELVIGGGGGVSRSGIKNKLRLYNVGDDRELDLIHELELEKDEDAPMSMAAHPESKQLVCGINSTLENLEKGKNENCRVYGVQDKKLTLIGTRGTLMAGDVEDYQKVTVISPDAGYLAVAGNRDLSLLTYPLLGLAAQPIHTTHDIYDATFSSTTLIIATTHNLLVYALPSRPTESPTSSPSKSKAKNRKRGKQRGGSKSQLEPQLELLRTIELPALPGGMVEGATFRAARFHPHISTTLYTIVNTSPPRTRKTKSAPRPAFVVKWTIPIDLNDEWEIRVRKVGEKGVTCFDVSPDGRLLAFGSSDFTIGILDTNTLGPLLTILKAHEFPPTTLRFNPTSTLLVSGSADNSVRIISVPAELGGQFWGTLTVIILTLLVILSAIAYQMLQ